MVWYPKITDEEARILVYDVTLHDLRSIAKEMDDRAVALKEARAGRGLLTPSEVPGLAAEVL